MSNKNENRSHLTIHNKTFEKRNTTECYKIVYTHEGIDALENYYNKIHGLPQAVRNFTMLRPTYHTEVCKTGLIEIFHFKQQFDNSFFENYAMISPNPSYFPLKADPLTAKDKQYGTGLVVWFFHPNQMELSKIKSKTNEELLESCNNVENDDNKNSELYIQRSNSQESISHINENSKIKYLASILNLDKYHLEFLKYVKKKIFNYIQLKFNVDANKDFVNIYSHFPYIENMVTFHLHVRINQGFHPLEKHHSMMFDDMINVLESGRSIKEHILERGICFDELEAGQFLESLKLDGIKLERIKNPFLLSSPFVLNPMASIQHIEQIEKTT